MFFTQVRFAELMTSCPGRGEKQVVLVLLIQNIYFKPNLNIMYADAGLLGPIVRTPHWDHSHQYMSDNSNWS